MPFATTADNVHLYFEECGQGTPVIFIHEYAGDYRSWEPQMRHFGRTHRCITFSSRGFAPSGIPSEAAFYTQDRAAGDIGAVLDHLSIQKSHVVGLSMGSFAALHFALGNPERVLSLCLGGCGYGSPLDELERFRESSRAMADAIQRLGMPAFAEIYLGGAGRVQYANKDPRGAAEFAAAFAAHDVDGAAHTQRFMQATRPSLYSLGEQLKALDLPVLIMCGDEDTPCLQPSLYLKKMLRAAALSVIPNSGHSINLEEPHEYNRQLGLFFAAAEAGRWPLRDPRADIAPSFDRLP